MDRRVTQNCLVCAAKDAQCIVVLKCLHQCDRGGAFRACKRDCRADRKACKSACARGPAGQSKACLAKCDVGYTRCRKECDPVRVDCHARCQSLPERASCTANCGACSLDLHR